MTKLKLNLFLNKDQEKATTFEFVGGFNADQLDKFEKAIKGYSKILVRLKLGDISYAIGTLKQRFVKSVETPYSPKLPIKHVRYQPKNATRSHNLDEFIMLYDAGRITLNELYAYANQIATIYNQEVFYEVLNYNKIQLRNFYSYLDLRVKAFNNRGTRKVYFKTFMEDYLAKTKEAELDQVFSSKKKYEFGQELRLYGLERPLVFLQDHVIKPGIPEEAEGWYTGCGYSYQEATIDGCSPTSYFNETGWGRKPIAYTSYHRDEILQESLKWLKEHGEILDYTWCEKHQDWFYDPDKLGQCPACADEALAEERAQITELSPWETHIYKKVDKKPKKSFDEVISDLNDELDRSDIWKFGNKWGYSTAGLKDSNVRKTVYDDESWSKKRYEERCKALEIELQPLPAAPIVEHKKLHVLTPAEKRALAYAEAEAYLEKARVKYAAATAAYRANKK